MLIYWQIEALFVSTNLNPVVPVPIPYMFATSIDPAMDPLFGVIETN